ncbi:MAG TPA: PAS domain S-box protein, partial [Prolixibacteraceae bacterium]|nr:PAS domain S-box protein [Prolixibacteraceae bacterium]
MITKKISMAGVDLVKKLTEVPFRRKDARTGHPTTYADDLKLLHQLQVLHLEMEMQSEHLRPDPLTLDKLNRKQNELFEFAPNGYFSLTPQGTIQEVNLTGANLMGMARVHLINQLFSNYISPEDQEVFRVCWFNLLETNDYQVFKVSMKRPDGHRLFVRIALSVTKIKNELYVLLAMTDVTMWKQVEEAQSFLLGCSWSESGKDFFQALAQYLGQSLDMDYVSIDKLLDDGQEAEVVSLYQDGSLSSNGRYKPSDSLYGRIPQNKSFCFPNGVHHLFPDDRLLQQLKAESCAGVTLWGAKGKAIGLIVVIGRKPLMDPRLTEMVLKQVSIRAAAELEHRQLEEALMQSRNALEMQVKERTAELQIINQQLRNEIRIRKHQEQSLIIAEEKYRTVADFTYHWETWISPNGEFIYVSPACKRISGYSVEDFMQNPSLFVEIAHPEDRLMVEDHFLNALKGDVPVGALEFRIITREGQERWIGHHCQPVYDASG